MTHQPDPGASQTIDHDASFARIRANLADLDHAIDDLRSEADRLLDSAARRNTVPAAAAALAAEPEFGVTDSEGSADAPIGGEGDEAELAFGVAEVEADISDAGEARVESEVAGGEAEAEPAFGLAESEVESEVESGDTEAEPAFGLVESEVESGEADVDIEAVERVLGSVDGEPADGDAGEDDDVSARLPAVDGPTLEPVTSAAGEATLGGAEGVSDSDPIDWGDTEVDDGAFDRFFSEEVEPEPAQRWLLDS